MSLLVTTALVPMTCHVCAVPFAMPEEMNKECLKNHSKSFWCPNGHSAVYAGKTEAEKLRDELEKVKAQHAKQLEIKASYITWLEDQRDAVKKERTVLKGKVTKLTNRIANGVCPCCKRTFPNLADHMNTKHPDYAPATQAELEALVST